jgi:hypothetical protein
MGAPARSGVDASDLARALAMALDKLLGKTAKALRQAQAPHCDQRNAG